MSKVFNLLFSLFIPLLSLSQLDTTIIKEQNMPEVRVDKDFSSKYRRQLHLLKRTYPIALKAEKVLTEYEEHLAKLGKKRLEKKYSRAVVKQLKRQFSYSIRDLYVSEGHLLMKLIYRETGMTVNEILKKYRGGFSKSFYDGIALLFDQDLSSTYDANGDDWITEMVIQDIISGRIKFNLTVKELSKEEYKKNMKEYRKKK